MLRNPPHDSAPMPLMEKLQVGARTLDVHAVGPVHQILQRLHARPVTLVVECADAEIEFLEGLRAHARLLGHGGRRPAHHDPFGFVHPVIQHRLEDARHELDPVGGHVGGFKNIVGTARGDVGLHLLHACQFDVRGDLVLIRRRALQELAGDPGPLDVHVGNRPPGTRRPHEGDDEGVGHVVGIDQHAFAFFQVTGKAGQNFGQFRITGVTHATTLMTRRPRFNSKST